MDKLKVVDAAWHGMKGAWGMAKDQLTGDSADDYYDPKLSPCKARGGRGPDRDDQGRLLLRRGQLLRPHVHGLGAQGGGGK